MAKISISIPDDLLVYMDENVDNRSALLESLLRQWQRQQQDKALAQACAAVDELSLGWEEEWQNSTSVSPKRPSPIQ